MLPKELLQSLNLSGEKDLKMAQNLWKMLDDMADSKPEEYRDFVNKNLKQGFEGMKEDRQKKEEKLKIQPHIGFLLKMKAKLIEQSIDSSKSQKFNLKLDKLEPWESVKSKFENQVKIYLNVCYSNRVLLPLDANKNQISTFTQNSIKQIVSIPHSLQQPQTKLNSSQQRVYYYMLVLNQQVYTNLQKVNMPYLMNLSVSLFQERIANKSNPLYKLYNPNQYGKIVYYQIEKSTIQLHKKKRFKVLKQSQPTKILLEAGADKDQSNDVNKKTKPTEVKFKEQIKQETVTQIKLPNLGGLQKKQQQAAQPVKKFIVEVEEQEKPNEDTSIPFTLKKTQSDISIQFLVPGITSIGDMELDISPVCVKLRIKQNNKKTEINLDKKINVEQVKAKLAKKEGKLKVTLPFG